MLRHVTLATLALTGISAARADGLTPASTSAQGQCYESGTSGPLVPCVLQGQTWTRVLLPADRADDLTVGGTVLPTILAGKAPLANPNFTGRISSQAPDGSEALRATSGAGGIFYRSSGGASFLYNEGQPLFFGTFGAGDLNFVTNNQLRGSIAAGGAVSFENTVTAPAYKGDVSATTVTPPGAPVARSLADHAADVARPEDYRLGSDPDDTLSFQRAASTGRTVVLQDGKTYTLCASIAVRRVIGLGGSAVVKACPGFPYGGGAEPEGSFFYNPNWLANNITDENLLVRNIIFDGSQITAGGVHASTGEFHAIKFRKARSILIDNVRCTEVGDCVALQATDRSVIRNSEAHLVTNVGFDHWEGVTNALVEGSTVTCDPTTASEAAIMFSGASSTLSDNQSVNVTSRGNRFLGGACKTGVFVNQLSGKSSTINAISEGDTCDAASVNTAGCIVYEGNVQGGRITGLTALNGNGPTAISLRLDTPGSGNPIDILVDGPRIYNWSTDGNNYSPITLFGTGHVLTNAMVKGGSNATSVATDSATTTVSGAFYPITTFGPVQTVRGTFQNPGCITAADPVTSVVSTTCR